MTDLESRRAALIEDARALGMEVRAIAGPRAVIWLSGDNRPRLQADGWSRATLAGILRDFAGELEREGQRMPNSKAQTEQNATPSVIGPED